MKTRGSSLIELILYTGLIITILSVLYQLFAISGIRKLNEIVEDEIYTNANHLIADFSRTITQATAIEQPVYGASSAVLSLSGGTVVYQLDANGRLTKTVSGVTEFLMTDKVTITDLSFQHHGPSTISPTVSMTFKVNGVQPVEGKIKSKVFQTAYTLR